MALGDLRHPLAPPTCNVRDEYVATEMHLGLVEDPPSTRATTTEVERRTEEEAQARRCNRVRPGRPRRRVQFSFDQLPDDVLREAHQVLVRCMLLYSRRHRLHYSSRPCCDVFFSSPRSPS